MARIFILLLLVANLYDPIASLDPEYRLNELTIPLQYTLEIIPYLEANDLQKRFTFDGTVSILITATANNRNSIRLHSKNLVIDQIKTTLTQQTTGNNINILSHNFDNVTDILTLELGKNLEVNFNYALTFVYTGQMSDDMYGFYRSSYTESGNTVWLGATQFQPTHARRVFPCFDEPQYKAIFTLSVVKPKNYEVISNMRPDRETIADRPTHNRVIFKPTPIMSTYLLSFIVSKFFKRANEVDTFRVWARPDQYKQTEYSFKLGQEILKSLYEFLQVEYYTTKIEKMDMAALPDFQGGAMENWGLLTYRETALLYDPDMTSLYMKQFIAKVIAHEQAHMWFGDLVTCNWWDNIWLNEGFATYFEFFALSSLVPDWQLEKQFIIDLQKALFFDSTNSTHPMTNSVNSSSEIKSNFDTVTYEKAASVIRMTEHLIGTDKFKLALKNYLTSNSFMTVKPENLLDHFQIVVGNQMNMTKILKPWITEAGYPLITINFNEKRTEVNVTQRKFMISPNPVKTKWTIPLTFASKFINSDFKNFKHFHLMDEIDSVKLPINGTGWVIFNVQQIGFYRVNYDRKSWELINDALKSKYHDGIPETNRAQIIDDLFNLALANEIDYNLVFKILEYLNTENHYLAWNAVFTNYQFLSKRMTKNNLIIFRNYIQRITSNIFEKNLFYGENDSQFDILNRGNVLHWACLTGNRKCIDTANMFFEQYRITKAKIPVDIRAPVYCTAIREGNQTEFNFLWSEYLKTDSSAEKKTILTALGCATKAELVKDYLDIVLSVLVRLQNRKPSITSIFKEENIDFALDYIISNFEKMKLGLPGKSAINEIISDIGDRLTTQLQFDKLKKFIEINRSQFDTKFETELSSSIESNLKWIAKQIPIIIKSIGDIKVNASSAVKSINFGILIILGLFIGKFV